ncbi:MAG: carboxylating nicotinate-nucleotide diphosphorylase [Deltaproteobacteria bacterium]|nr:carboxylating nicotinate-nucleotide diphosphorylase [Deltaproteobacteria bacterium]
MDTDCEYSLIDVALREDLGDGDITCAAVIPEACCAMGRLVAKEACVIAGLHQAFLVFSHLDPTVTWRPHVRDGAHVAPGMWLAEVVGKGRAIVQGERVALNLLQHLSAVATLTQRFVAAVAGTGITVLDTRKTLPGLRTLQKAAVVAGGGKNHRMGLYDRYLIKSNHVAPHRTLRAALAYFCRHRDRAIPLEVEVRTVDEIDAAIDVRAEWILLDNFLPHDVAVAVARINGRAKIEISGGITLHNIRDYAVPGVDAISIGALTHSARAIDLHLQVEGLPQTAEVR